MTSPDRAQTPAAPGGLGQAIPAPELLAYLDALTAWRSARRQELDRLDAAALAAQNSAEYTGDLTLAMTMWQSVTDRLERLTTLWDSGRAGAQQREEMSRLIWGTGLGLSGGPGSAGMGLSLVEACRLSDALTAALRTRLSFDPVAADLAARITATRATLQRIRESLADPRAARPSTIPDVDALRRELEALAVRAAAGSDVAGPVGVIESTAARAERDLIVASAAHRDLGRDYRAALDRRRELEKRALVLHQLVERAVSKVTPTPRLAVPDVDRLGPVPQAREALDSYQARLENVSAAMTMVDDAYSAALGARDELRGLLKAYAAKASAIGRACDPAVAAAYEHARRVLWSAPCSIPEARELVAAYQRSLASNPAGGSSS